eukprot:1140052-Rhodomonas_salina.2
MRGNCSSGPVNLPSRLNHTTGGDEDKQRILAVVNVNFSRRLSKPVRSTQTISRELQPGFLGKGRSGWWASLPGMVQVGSPTGSSSSTGNSTTKFKAGRA